MSSKVHFIDYWYVRRADGRFSIRKPVCRTRGKVVVTEDATSVTCARCILKANLQFVVKKGSE